MFKIFNNYSKFTTLFNQRPKANAKIRGSAEYPNISGDVWFYQTAKGVLVVADISGLPNNNEKCKSPFFAFHIHTGESCTGNVEDPFADAGMHFNPDSCPHPYHAGDLPPLMGANGYAFSATITNRFNLEDVIGKTIIIHSMPDDFTTQPSGNSGKKIACGKIVLV